MIGAPLLILGVLVALSALVGARATARSRGAVVDALLAPIHPATWAAFAAVLAGLLVTAVGFGVVVGLISSGVSGLLVGIGIVLIGLGIEAARFVARAERARAAWADPRPLHPHVYRTFGQTPREFLSAIFLDVARWRDVVYVVIAMPLAVLEFVAVVTLWALTITALSVPLWYLAGSVPPPVLGVASWLERIPLATGTLAGLAGIAGVVLLPLAAVATRGLMSLHRAVVSGLLCESEQKALERRVATLETSRRAVIDVEANELRRIERDLHDGAQQRLVMLSINLGLAADRIDADPASAKALVEDARDQARQALAELRDLVRGIAPAILLDRGLVPALSALASRGPVPIVVTSDLPDGSRLPDAVERAAYYVVTEAVANIVKHAAATRCEIRIRREADQLVVEIEDDGVGGARIVPGGGLAGLVGRVEALDGLLTVTSPTGGPTVVRASIPLPVAAAGADSPI